MSHDTAVYSWGHNTHGQLGHGDTRNRNDPVVIDALRGKNIEKSVYASLYDLLCLLKYFKMLYILSHLNDSGCLLSIYLMIISLQGRVWWRIYFLP